MCICILNLFAFSLALQSPMDTDIKEQSQIRRRSPTAKNWNGSFVRASDPATGHHNL